MDKTDSPRQGLVDRGLRRGTSYPERYLRAQRGPRVHRRIDHDLAIESLDPIDQTHEARAGRRGRATHPVVTHLDVQAPVLCTQGHDDI